MIEQARERQVRLPDGRRMAVVEYGAGAAAPAVLAFHGTPGGRLMFAFLDAPARALGLRVLCPDRPGVGGSDPAPDRTIASWASDVAGLADALDLPRFGALGYSCGGPYALACAAGLAERVTGTACLASVGPLDRSGALDGLGADDAWYCRTVLRHPGLARRRLQAEALVARLAPGVARGAVLADLPPHQADWARKHPLDLRFFVDGCRQGARGAVLDYRLWALPWDLDWAAVRGPVHLFHGDADRTVPLHHARDLVDRLPDAVLHVVPDAGHFSIQDCAPDALARAAGR